MNTNDNIDQGIEVEAPPTTMYGEDDADSIEQLPNANDDVVLMNNLPTSSHASIKYIIVAVFVGIAGFAAFFGVGFGSALGIGNAVNKSNAASVSSASSMAFTASTNGAKAGKVAKAIKTSTKSSKSKSGKSEDSCPPQYVTSGIGLPADILDIASVLATLPVTLAAGCGCTITNVAIAIGIDHTRVGNLEMILLAPGSIGGGVGLVANPPSDANLVPGNKITFDDSTLAGDPQTLGDGLGDNDPIPAATYFAQGDSSGEVNPGGLGLYNGTALPEAGNWALRVADFVPGNTGTIQSVELTIECAE